MSEITNPYLAARREWDERFGDAITRSRNWRVLALVTAGIALISSSGLVILSARQKLVVYPVLIDSLGRTVASGIADQATADPMRRTIMSQWVENLRTVTTDGVAQLKMIEKVYGEVPAGSQAEKEVSDLYRSSPPQEHARTETVSVDVNSVIETSPTTFEVDWTETTRDLYGTVKGTERWRGLFNTAVNPPKDERTARINPLGIYVLQAHWSKVI